MTKPDCVRDNLGLGFGSIYVYGDGTVEYIKGLSTVFEVRVQEVTGCSVTKGKRWYDRNLQVLGHGTTLAVLADLGVDHVETTPGWRPVLPTAPSTSLIATHSRRAIGVHGYSETKY